LVRSKINRGSASPAQRGKVVARTSTRSPLRFCAVLGAPIECFVSARICMRSIFEFGFFYSYLDVFQKLSVDGDQFRHDPHHDDLEADDQ